MAREPSLAIWSSGVLGLLVVVVVILFLAPKRTTGLAINRIIKQHTIRIDEIPSNKPHKALQDDLKSLLEDDPELKEGVDHVVHHFLSPRDRNFACATATFHASISANDLATKLTRAATRHHYRFDAHFRGITPLCGSPNGADVDIVAVPGLSSHAIGSWKSPSGQDVWLRDFLPCDVEGIRVLLYGYDTSLLGSDSKDSIEDLGKRFLESVKAFRRDTRTDRRPIIFIGHSLGGLLIKEALVHAHNRSDDSQNDHLRRACYGLLLFGVPNLGLRHEQLCNIVRGKPNELLIRDLVIGNDSEPSPFLKRISTEFSRCCKGEYQYKVVSFFERNLSPTVQVEVPAAFGKSEFSPGLQIQPDGTLSRTGSKLLLVTEKSATSTGLTVMADENNIPLSTDHTGLVKFQGRSQNEYSIVKGKLETLVSEAREEVGKRFPEDRSLITMSIEEYCRDKRDADDCLRDLFLTDPREDRVALKRKKGDRAPHTCEWISNTEEFSAWLDAGRPVDSGNSTTNVLWLYGNPGTGKSTMAMFLTEKLSKDFSATKENTLAYFFCDSSFDTRKTAIAVVRSLLYQLVHQHPRLLDHLLPKYRERKAQLFDSFDTLWTILTAVASDQKTGHIYCIVDALDECDAESQSLLLRQLEETFKDEHFASKFHVLITSRPYPEIRESLEQFAHKDLASFPEAEQDIGRCIEQRMADLTKRKKYTENVERQIRDILKDKAQGTFLWIGLACSELEHVPSKDAVKLLQSMPKGLHSLYKTLLDAALAQDGAERDVIWRILNFVAVSLQPMTILQLSEACQLHQEQDNQTRIRFARDQVDTCRLMVVVQDDKVLLLHQSVKDYLAVARTTDFNELNAHADLACRCIDTLMSRCIDLPMHYRVRTKWRVAPPDVDFLSYAMQNWPHHAGMAESRFQVRDSQAEFFAPKSLYLEQWLSALTRSHFGWQTNLRTGSSILHVAGQWGITALVDYVSQENERVQSSETSAPWIDFDCVDSAGETALEVAVREGHVRTVHRLLDHDATADKQVLEAAASNWRHGKDIMALLLDRRGDQIVITEDVVKAAAGNIGNSKGVITLLLNRRGD